MQLGIFLKIHAVIALLFAIGFIFMPATILAYYTTVPVNEVGSYMSQLFGSALITCSDYNFAFSTYWPN